MTTPPSSTDPQDNGALEQLRSVLIEGETLEAWAMQSRLFALTHRRILIAATSGRFICLARGLFSGFDMVDLRWQDLKEAKLRVGIFGADLTLTASTTADLAGGGSREQRLVYTGLVKERTEAVYRLCQAHDQAWREKRRIRELEEMRAQSGGFQFAAGAGAPSAGAGGGGPAGGDDAVARLQQARKMLDEKLISDSEYEAIKARVIGNV